MPYSQPCQDVELAYLKKVFEGIRVESPESLCSLNNDALLILLNNWFHFKDLQTESCNFTDSLFASIYMNEITLNTRINVLRSIIQKIDCCTPILKDNPGVIEYSKKLMNLAVLDHEIWLCIQRKNYKEVQKLLQQLKEEYNTILPYHTESLEKYIEKLFRKVRLCELKNVSKSYQNQFSNSWTASLLCNPLDCQSLSRNFDHLEKNFNLERLASDKPSDESYYSSKIFDMKETIFKCALGYEIFNEISTFSRDKVVNNIKYLQKILKKTERPELEHLLFVYSYNIKAFLTQLLRYHQIRLSVIDNEPEQTQIFLQELFNKFEETIQTPESEKFDFEKLKDNSHDTSVILKCLCRRKKSILSVRSGQKLLPQIRCLIAPLSYDKKIFENRIEVLESVIKNIDNFGELSSEQKGYIKELFNLFLLDHQARFNLNENRPEEAMKCLRELREKSEGIMRYYSEPVPKRSRSHEPEADLQNVRPHTDEDEMC